MCVLVPRTHPPACSQNADAHALLTNSRAADNRPAISRLRPVFEAASSANCNCARSSRSRMWRGTLATCSPATVGCSRIVRHAACRIAVRAVVPAVECLARALLIGDRGDPAGAVPNQGHRLGHIDLHLGPGVAAWEEADEIAPGVVRPAALGNLARRGVGRRIATEHGEALDLDEGGVNRTEHLPKTRFGFERAAHGGWKRLIGLAPRAIGDHAERSSVESDELGRCQQPCGR